MFAVLHIPDFALHAVLRTESAIGKRPAALFSDSGKKSVVLAANSSARAAGVELGMSAPQAVARCAQLVIRAAVPAAESEARAALLAVGFTLSPSIEDTAPGICTIDLKGADSSKLVSCAHTAIESLIRLDLPATAGVAATPLLALYAARQLSLFPAIPGRNPSDDSRRGKVLLVENIAGFLAPLPLSTADPSAELSAVLANWGIRTLGGFTALPRDEIVHRFGAEGLALWQRAAGGAARPLHTMAPPKKFWAEMEFEQELETLEPLLFIVRRFLERLTLELQGAQFVAAELALTLLLEDEARHTIHFRLPEPTTEVEILFRTLHTHLESLRTDTGIVAAQLLITPARPLVRQQGLFETGLRDPQGFGETLARVSALVGADRVGTPQLIDAHRADATTLVPPFAVIPPPAEPPVHPPLGLPLRRFRPPLPARLEFTEGRATYLWTERVHGEISGQRGPWPSNGDWWQSDRAWARREWDIALASGGLYRLLRIADAWFLEGEYD